MAAVEKRTFSLPAEQADRIDTPVASGTFASASDVAAELRRHHAKRLKAERGA